MRTNALLSLIFAALLAATLATVAGAKPAGKRPNAKKSQAVSVPFSSCDDLVSYARDGAVKMLASKRYKVYPSVPMSVEDQVSPSAEKTEGQSSAPGGSSSDSSQTNVQEEGVDEPDIAKSDGSTIFVINGGTLKAVDARSDKTTLLGSVVVDGAAQELLISGNRALVFAEDYSPLPITDSNRVAMPTDVIVPTGRQTVITEIDISDPRSMRVVHTEKIDGQYESARLTGTTARIVLSSEPSALDDGSPEGDVRASNWLPTAKLSRGRKGRATTKTAVSCDDVRHPKKFSGVGTVTVLTVDMNRGLPAVDSDAVMADVGSIYASQTGLYLASTKWNEPATTNTTTPTEETATTELHKFDTSENGKTEFQASGSVSGTLLNEWSLSEFKGSLRAVTTENTSATNYENESKITVLQNQGGKLGAVGHVGGLGKNENVYAVRFIDDIAFVVTFRRMDPLYTVDLSNPTDPKVVGELKIAGYSAYLHPVGDGLLLGVGQDASESGRRLGTQLSLFDISDLRNPKRLFNHTLESSSNSEAEYDHKAFLYWPSDKLAVIPVSKYEYESNDSFAGSVAFRVDRSTGIKELSRITHSLDKAAYKMPIDRTFVVGKRLFTLSSEGIKANSLETFKEESWLPFS